MNLFASIYKNQKKAKWLLFILACLLYTNTIPNKWAIDDGIIIHQNKFVQKGIKGIPEILSKDAFSGFYGKDVNAIAGGRYRPLTPVIFALQAEAFVLVKKDETEKVVNDQSNNNLKDLSAETWFPNLLHFFNMLWYGLLCVVIYSTLLLLFSQAKKWSPDKINFLAFVTTLLYTVHPLHTEAVTNVKGLDEILAMLGSVGSLFCILKLYISTNNATKKTKWVVGAVISYFLALLAKESTVTFIVVIPLTLYFFTAANAKSIFRLTIPLVVPLLLFLGIRQAVLYEPNKTPIAEELMNNPFLILDPNAQYESIVPQSSVKKLVNPNANTFVKMPYSNELATNFYTYGVYLKLLFIPTNLTVDYYPRHIEIKSFADLLVLLSVVVHLFLLIWSLLHIRKKITIAFGILYYFITFSIFSNLLFPIGTNMAERFMFMPSLGFCLIIASLLFEIGRKLNKNITVARFSKVYIVTAAVALLFSIRTFSRNFDWKDNYTLFSKDILVSQNSGKLNTDLAAILISKAILLNSEKEKETENWNVNDKKVALQKCRIVSAELLEKALPLLHKALEIHPLSNSAWLQMAQAQHFLGVNETNTPNVNYNFLQTAIAAYDLAYSYRGAGMDSLINEYQSICYMDLGKLMGQKFGNIPVAIAKLEQAKKLNPKNAEVFLLLGTTYALQNNFREALRNAEQSLKLQPNNSEYKRNLEIILSLKKK